MNSHTSDVSRGSRPIRGQFSLRAMMWLFALVSLLCVPGAYFGPAGWRVSLVLVAVAVCVFVIVLIRFTLVETLVCVVLIGILIALLFPATTSLPRGAARRMQCANNLKQIALALHNYEARYGTFPPAYIADENGKPMHSWRVLILPYLEQEPLYKAYNFDEPWDGPNNCKLHKNMPTLFQCPSEAAGQPNTNEQTCYLAVIGKETMWPGTESRASSEVTDGTANTVHVVEVHNSGVHWMEPRDLDFETTSATVSSGPVGRTVSSCHIAGANAAFGDGHVEFLQEDIPGAEFQAMLTVAGGE